MRQLSGRAVTEMNGTSATVTHRYCGASSPLAEPGQYVYAIDVFTIRDHLIERLDIYYR
jgi:hypothetical protein